MSYYFNIWQKYFNHKFYIIFSWSYAKARCSSTSKFQLTSLILNSIFYCPLNNLHPNPFYILIFILQWYLPFSCFCLKKKYIQLMYFRGSTLAVFRDYPGRGRDFSWQCIRGNTVTGIIPRPPTYKTCGSKWVSLTTQ